MLKHALIWAANNTETAAGIFMIICGMITQVFSIIAHAIPTPGPGASATKVWAYNAVQLFASNLSNLQGEKARAVFLVVFRKPPVSVVNQQSLAVSQIGAPVHSTVVQAVPGEPVVVLPQTKEQ
jgi:hypothetical protein